MCCRLVVVCGSPCISHLMHADVCMASITGFESYKFGLRFTPAIKGACFSGYPYYLVNGMSLNFFDNVSCSR